MIILSPIFVIREIYLVMNHLKFQIFIVRSDIFFIVADNVSIHETIFRLAISN